VSFLGFRPFEFNLGDTVAALETGVSTLENGVSALEPGRSLATQGITGELSLEPAAPATSAVGMPSRYLPLSIPDATRRPIQKRLTAFEEAYKLICDAADYEASAVERSNSFDRWKAVLRAAAREEDFEADAVHRRQLLGLLLNAASGRDIGSVDPGALNALREGSRVLRTPCPSELDFRTSFRQIAEQGLSGSILKTVDAEASELNRVEEFIDGLLNEK
jgi:hypothetical protein